jgi:hypothetical protein
MMEAVQTSKTLVNVYQSTRLYNPEDSHLQLSRTSYSSIFYFFFFQACNAVLWQYPSLKIAACAEICTLAQYAIRNPGCDDMFWIRHYF